MNTKNQTISSLIYKKLKTNCKKIDLFGEPISLRFSQEKRFSTFIGGLSTILLLILLILLNQSKLTGLINRTNTYISRYDKVSPIPQDIDLRNRFALTIDPPIMNSINGKRYFDIMLKLNKYEFYSNGSVIYSGKENIISPCNVGHFPMISEEDLKNNGINNWLCPNFDIDDFIIKGTYSKDVYQYISIQINQCTENNSKNGSFCASKEEIEEIKKKRNGKIYVQLKIINNLLNLEDYNNPFSSYVDEVSYLINTNKLFVQKEVYLNAMTIETDKTMSFNFMRNDENVKTDKLFSFNRNVDTFSINEDIFFKTQQQYTSIFIRSSQLSQLCKRKYDSFQDYLQAFGALYSIMFLIFKILVITFTKDILTAKVANSLYLFPNNRNPTDLSDSNMTGKSLPMISLTNRYLKFKNNLKVRLREFFLKEKFIGHKISDINKTVVEDMDLIQLLRKIKEIENLKKIFLTKDQKIVFEYASKPNFVKNRTLSKKSFTKISISGIPKEKNIQDPSNKLINNLANAYFKLNSDKNKMNQKIINLLDPDIKFEINKMQLKAVDVITPKSEKNNNIQPISQNSKKKINNNNNEFKLTLN